MERKNTILLTVIAVATLLVAVVGATFAYFTATTGTTGNSETVNVTTESIGSATLELSPAGKKEYLLYPGGLSYTGVKVEAKPAADDTTGNEYTFNYKLELAYSNAATTTLNYTLYKTTAEVTADPACTMTPDVSVAGETRYYYNCTNREIDFGSVVKEGTMSTTTGTELISVDGLDALNTDDAPVYYYLVVDYPNSGNQNEDQNDIITFEIKRADAVTAVVKQ